MSSNKNNEQLNQKIAELQNQLDTLQSVLGSAQFERILQIPVKERVQRIKNELCESLPLSKYLIDNIYEYMQYQTIEMSSKIKNGLVGENYECKTQLTVEKNMPFYYECQDQEPKYYLFDQDIKNVYFEYYLYKSYHEKRDDQYYNVVIQDPITGFFLFVDVLERYNYGTGHDFCDFYCYTSIEELLQAHENHTLGIDDKFGIKFREMHGL